MLVFRGVHPPSWIYTPEDAIVTTRITSNSFSRKSENKTFLCDGHPLGKGCDFVATINGFSIHCFFRGALKSKPKAVSEKKVTPKELEVRTGYD